MPAHMLFGLAGAGGAQGPFTTIIGSYGERVDTVDRATYTFSSTSVASMQNADKLLLGLVIDDSGANSTTSVTYAGNAMTLVAGPVAVANDYVEIWEMNAGGFIAGDGTVIVTLANTALGAQFKSVVVRGITSAAVHDTATSTADPASLTIDVPAGGVIFALTHATGTLATGTWTNLNTLAGSDNQLGSHNADWAVSAGLSVEVNRAVSYDYTGNDANFKGAAVSYG